MKLQHATTAITRRGREKNREERQIFFSRLCKTRCVFVVMSWNYKCSLSLPCSVWLWFNCAHTKMRATVATMMTATAAKWRLQWKSAKWKWECASARAKRKRKIMIFVKQASAHLTSIIHVQWNKSDQDVVGKSGGKMWLSYLPPNTIHNDT